MLKGVLAVDRRSPHFPSGPVLGVADEGALGNAAIHLAARLGEALALDVVVTTVVPPHSPGGGAARETRVIREGQATLDRSVAELRRLPRSVLLVGEPAQSILTLAQREAASLVVMATPEDLSERSTRLGNAYIGVSQVLTSPVVVIPAGVGVLAWTDGPIVAGTVGSQAGVAGAAVATSLADGLDAPLVHVRVADPPYGPSPTSALRAAATRHRAQLVIVERGRLCSRPADGLAMALGRSAPCPIVIVPAAGVGTAPDPCGADDDRTQQARATAGHIRHRAVA